MSTSFEIRGFKPGRQLEERAQRERQYATVYIKLVFPVGVLA